MLIEEAKWFGERIAELDGDPFPMLNLGSSTEVFRTREQPWIDAYIFRPLREHNRRVIHIDLKSAPGVDIVGDLAHERTLRQVQAAGVRSALCSNLLEHVPDRTAVCHAIDAAIPNGGYIFLSCPYRYPLHLDPIDTMFRPDVAELAALFPGTEIIRSDILRAGTYLDLIGRRPASIAKRIVRLGMPFYKPKQWYTAVHHIPWLFRHFEATCVLLQKRG